MIFSDWINVESTYNLQLQFFHLFQDNTCKYDWKISGLKIHKITRLQNQILKMNFDKKFEILTDGSDAISVYKYVKDIVCSIIDTYA